MWPFKFQLNRAQNELSQLPDAYKEFLRFHNEYRNYKEVEENDRRLQKRLKKESSIEEKKLKREKGRKEREDHWFCGLGWIHWLWLSENFGPETYDLRPAVIQMKLYILNAIQGLVTCSVLVYFNITNIYDVPSACGLLGLYVLSYFPTAMDFFGSIFGMITSYHLEGTFGYQMPPPRKKPNSDASPPTKVTEQGDSQVPETAEIKTEQSCGCECKCIKSKFSKYKWILKYLGPCGLCNIVLSLCLRKGRSRTFVNTMGYLSWILLQLAWLFNLFFVAHYHWLHIFSASYRNAIDQCKNGVPKPPYCSDFDCLYLFLFVTIAVTFVIRSILVFFIGMCFKETPLRRYRPNDPTVEIASTCSDTDVDYSKVPEPLLRPYLRRQPWMTNWPVAGASKKTLSKAETKSKRKRVLNVREAQAEKTLQMYKDIRRAKPMLGKKRRDVKIRKVKEALDTIQMPAELMTAKARAWLSEDESDGSKDGKKLNTHERQYQQHRRRPVTRRKAKGTKYPPSSSSGSLEYVHDPESKSKIPLTRIVKQKLPNLSDRVSTDDSWSGNSDSMFEVVPLSFTEQDLKNAEEAKEKKMDEEYMALYMEMEDSKSSDESTKSGISQKS